jgi:hypothetical protein
MSRDLDPQLATGLSAGLIGPVILVQLTFRSQTCYAWSGVGTLVWNGNSFLGVGSLGKLGTITEGSDVKADGTTLELSGIDKVFLGECLTDIQIGAPAKVWFGNMLNGVLIGAPYLVFSGCIDKPTFSIGGDTVTIRLALENRLIDQGRATMSRYTSADQRVKYPDDTAFVWVESLNDQALVWGS